MSKYDVQLFKMTSGEEFIAQVTDTTKTTITFSHPVQTMHTEDGKMQFVPWVPMSKEQTNFKINHQHIMFLRNVPEALSSAHKENFGSRIQVPNSNIIV